MNSSAQCQSCGALPSLPPGEAAQDGLGIGTELARYLPHLSRMSAQLKQASTQIESLSWAYAIAFKDRGKRKVDRVSHDRLSKVVRAMGLRTNRRSSLIQNCSDTLVKILNATEEAGAVSRRAIYRIHQMEQASQMIDVALLKLERIAHENKMLAMNARIEAAHAGIHGAGFAVGAVEVVSQTEKAQEVTAQVSGLIADLRALAESTLEDLRRTNEPDLKARSEMQAGSG